MPAKATAAATDKPKTESVDGLIDNESEVVLNNEGKLSNIWNSAEDINIKDINKRDDFFDNVVQFMGLLGLPKESFSRYNTGISPDNKLYAALNGNALTSLLFDGGNFGSSYGIIDASVKMQEYHHMLYDALYNPRVALGGTATAKDELLQCVVKADYYGKDITNDICRKLSRDVYELAMKVSDIIIQTLNRLQPMTSVSDNPNDPINFNTSHDISDRTLGNIKLVNEVIFGLSQLYEDFMFAVAQKLKYIEAESNRIFADNKENIKSILTLNAPYIDIKDNDFNADVTPSVPATTRIPIEIQDLFTLTAFNEMSLYDEYLRSLPEFENNYYLSEAGASNVMNMIMSIIEGWINTAKSFFFKNFKPASDWVIQKDKEHAFDPILKNVKIDANTTSVFKYNLQFANNSVNKISLTNIADKLKTFDPTKATGDDWIKDFYPMVDGKSTYDWFQPDPKVGAIRYENQLLYGNGATETKAVAEQPVNQEAFVTEFKAWIADVKASNDIAKIVIDSATSIKNSVNAIKTKLVSENNANQTEKPAAAQPNTTDNNGAPNDTNTTGETTITPDTNAKQESVDFMNEALTVRFGNTSGSPVLQQLQTALTQTWTPIVTILLRVLRTEYGYIKSIWTSYQGGANQSAQTNQPNKQ